MPQTADRRRLALAAALLLGSAGRAAAVDEIQVYTGEIAAPKEWSLIQHLNYPLSGRSGAPFPGALPYANTLYGTPELAYGVNPNWEVGLYMPFGATNDRYYPGGFKLRSLLIKPYERDGELYYGLNTELSWQTPKFSQSFWNLEFRPILGVKLGRWELTTNPIVGVGIGGGAGSDFTPANRVAYSFTEKFALGLESYADLGPFGGFHAPRNQSHALFLATDFALGPLEVNFGVGHGLTPASDRWAVKMIFGRAF